MGGHKVNLQFFFDAHGPQLAQILNRATEAFNQYFRNKGITDHPFSITTAVIFNEKHETWDRLERSSQLVHNGQIYLFQPDVVDIPAEIPDPISATQYLSEYISPQRSFVNQSGISDTRSSSPGAQIPATYDPYFRQRFLDSSPAYQLFGSGSPDPTRRRVSIGGTSSAYTGDLSTNPEYQNLVRKSQPRHYNDIDGPSIFQEERKHESDLSRLTLDQYRDVVRSEARDFTPSPSRDRQYN
eukprot:GDKK01010515.1.p1 GENE.GDKK01010515.1~~GDKK01010515.1.p1  ORF type:complete len:241 (-),score=15.18 GDKK01010515.1:155-877(-)